MAGALGLSPGLNCSLAVGKGEERRGEERRGDGEKSQEMNSALDSARARQSRPWLVPLAGLNHREAVIKEIQIFVGRLPVSFHKEANDSSK